MYSCTFLDDVEKNFLTVSTVISVDLAALERLEGEPDSKSVASTQLEVSGYSDCQPFLQRPAKK
jgi:hypothetical protein